MHKESNDKDMTTQTEWQLTFTAADVATLVQEVGAKEFLKSLDQETREAILRYMQKEVEKNVSKSGCKGLGVANGCISESGSCCNKGNH